MSDPNEETRQRIEWKTRIVTALINRTFDDATMTELLFAALDEAHANGVKDAAYIVQKISNASPESIMRNTLATISRKLLELNIANKQFAGMLAGIDGRAAAPKQ